MPQTRSLPLTQLRIIWFALFMSTMIYAVVLFVVSANHPVRPLDQMLGRPFTLICYALAIGSFIAGTILWNVMRDRPLQLRMVASMAVFESGAVFGMVAAFLTYDWRVYVPAWVLCLMGFARCFPGENAD